jgi:dihydrofolate synthase/folylpolyglutamate synthase
MAKEFQLEGEKFDNVNEALKAALDHSLPHDIIVVCGSVFVIAEVESL